MRTEHGWFQMHVYKDMKEKYALVMAKLLIVIMLNAGVSCAGGL